MSIATEAWPSFDPGEFYGPENRPPYEEQEAFLHHALLEAAYIDDPTRFAKGPFGEHFATILEGIDSGLRQLDPEFTPEYLMPYSYQSPTTRDMSGDLEPDERIALRRLKEERDKRINDLATKTIGPHVVDQIIPRGVLDEPAYRYQGQHWKDYESQRACANACFRMVFEGITGFDVYEDILAEQMIKKRGHSIVADSEYRKIFGTEVFNEVSDKHVQSIELMGADIKAIGTIAMRIKQRNADAKVFSVITLGSERASKDVWHQCVLLGADARSIICHDPGTLQKRPARLLPREDFVKRWAVAHNRAQIFISA